MYEIIKAVINRGNYDLSTILKRIDTYHIEGKVTDDERDQLYNLARGGGVSAGFNVEAEIGKLWEAVRELRGLHTDTSEDTENSTDTVADYVQPTGAHDAYYAGDVVSYNGTVYKCIAPAGMACVWSPEVMPSYWAAQE